MQCDETIWSCIGKDFCSFRTTFEGVKLCRNVYNVTGQCTKATCPLANSFYGTVLEEQGICYLYLKTIERAHTPRKLWEKIKLSTNKDKALEQIEAHMKNIYKDHQIQKCSQRYLRIREYLARMRKIALRPQVTYESESAKTARREKNREIKALKAAQLHKSVQEELIARLRKGQYGDIYNFSRSHFDKLTAMGEDDVEVDSEEEDDEADSITQGVEDIDSDDLSDIEDIAEPAHLEKI